MGKKRIRTQSAKAKGRRLQQWVCQEISELLAIPWGKDELIASREGAQSGTDIRLLGKTKRLFPFSVECKAEEAWAVAAWIEQAKKNQKKRTDWLLVVKKRRSEPVVIMDAKQFFELLKQWDYSKL